MRGEKIIQLEIGTAHIPVAIVAAHVVESLHTRREMRVVTAEARIRGKDTAELLLQGIAGGAVRGVAEGTSEPILWNARSPMHSISDGRYLINLELTEYESMNATRLQVAEFDLTPIRYKETTEENGIAIEAVVLIPKADNERFRSLLVTRDENTYHPVRRVGVSDETIQSRFGFNTPWSEHDDGFKYTIHLIDARSDASQAARNEPPFGLDLEAVGAARALAYRIELMERLTALLVKHGALAQADVDAAKADAIKAAPVRQLNFTGVRDAERYFG